MYIRQVMLKENKITAKCNTIPPKHTHCFNSRMKIIGLKRVLSVFTLELKEREREKSCVTRKQNHSQIQYPP